MIKRVLGYISKNYITLIKVIVITVIFIVLWNLMTVWASSQIHWSTPEDDFLYIIE